MDKKVVKQNIFRLFADILEYPQDVGIKDSVNQCKALLAAKNAETGMLLGKFRTFMEKKSVGQIQEVYTVTFDLDATYHPYVGYHLFGETYKRSVFLVQLKQHYRAKGFAVKENELPDHVAVLLRFMAACNDEDMTRELACEALLPTLETMLKQNKQADNSDKDNKKIQPYSGEKRKQLTSPYRHVLLALRLVIQQQYPIEKEVETHV